MLLGSAHAASAGGGGPPLNVTEDHLYAGCELDGATLDAIEEDIEAGTLIEANVSFIIVYNLFEDNNGQFVDTEPSTFVTGPVLCIDPNEVTIDPALEDEVILDVDVESADEALVLRTSTEPAPEFTFFSDRVCHTVEGNVDCVDIFHEVD